MKELLNAPKFQRILLLQGRPDVDASALVNIDFGNIFYFISGLKFVGSLLRFQRSLILFCRVFVIKNQNVFFKKKKNERGLNYTKRVSKDFFFLRFQ